MTCPLTPAQRARLHPALQSDENWIWVADAKNPDTETLDRVLAICNRRALMQVVRLLIQSDPTPLISNTSLENPTEVLHA